MQQQQQPMMAQQAPGYGAPPQQPGYATQPVMQPQYGAAPQYGAPPVVYVQQQEQDRRVCCRSSTICIGGSTICIGVIHHLHLQAVVYVRRVCCRSSIIHTLPSALCFLPSTRQEGPAQGTRYHSEYPVFVA